MTVEEAVKQAIADARDPKVFVVASFIQYRALELVSGLKGTAEFQNLVNAELDRQCIPRSAPVEAT